MISFRFGLLGASRMLIVGKWFSEESQVDSSLVGYK